MTFSGRLTWPNEPMRAVTLLRPRSVRRVMPKPYDAPLSELLKLDRYERCAASHRERAIHSTVDRKK